VDIAILEVGMGGRLDATNVTTPLISVITDIGLDHQQYLGDTIAKIAAEKCGIIKPNGFVVTLPQHPEANDVIGRFCTDQNATAVNAAEYMPDVSPTDVHHALTVQRESGVPRNRYPLNIGGEEIAVDSPLIGRHQIRNLALAIETAIQLKNFGFEISPEQIERGIRETYWPGRLQWITQGGYTYLLDVAHNSAGAWALRAALSQYCDGRPITLVFGAMRDKDLDEIGGVLFLAADRIITTKVENPRAAEPKQLAAIAERTGTPVIATDDVAAALDAARSQTAAAGVIVVTGSVYLVGEALALLQK
jgi:dihydrofolate synthase/folylpolyglutamate synthase